MSRAERGEAILRAVEDELKIRLRADLPRVAAGGDSLYFFNAQFNPHALPPRQLSARGCEAFEVGCQILSLRKELGIFGESAAETFLEAVAKHATADSNRLGARRAAVQLLAALEALWEFEGAA